MELKCGQNGGMWGRIVGAPTEQVVWVLFWQQFANENMIDCNMNY